MSFCNQTKSELCRFEPKRKCCLLAELIGLIKANGTIIEEDHKKILRLVIENSNIAKRMYSLIKRSLGLQPTVTIKKSRRLKEHNIYIIDTEGNIDFGILNLKSMCCQKAYLRGIFLGAGSITDPKNNYHVEFVFKNLEFAENIIKILRKFSINARISKRKNNHILYIKEVEQISKFLNIIGAYKAMLDLENVRILKEMKNTVNRLVNCETANLSKTVEASIKQIETIKFLKEINKLDNLPKPLKDIAYLRLEHPDYSLSELGALLDPPIGKSGVNHRLRKILEIAESYRKVN